MALGTFTVSEFWASHLYGYSRLILVDFFLDRVLGLGDSPVEVSEVLLVVEGVY